MGLPAPDREKQIQHILSGYHDELDKIGISEKLLARKLKAELNARETKAFKHSDKDGNSEVVYSKGMVAWDIRQKARMSAEKILGIAGADKQEHSGPGGGPIPFDEIVIRFVKPEQEEKPE
jgi:hypothetical protein